MYFNIVNMLFVGTEYRKYFHKICPRMYYIIEYLYYDNFFNKPFSIELDRAGFSWKKSDLDTISIACSPWKIRQ